MSGINSLADVRPGDIGIMKMGGFMPGFFPVAVGQWACKESFRVGPFRADHVLMCVEAGVPGPTEIHTNPGIGIYNVENRAKMTQAGRIGQAPRAVQAMPRGAEEIVLRADKHWTDGVVWFRLQEDYAGQAEDAAAIARLFVTEKVPYSFLSYAAVAAWSRGLKAAWLEERIDRRGPVLPHIKRRGPWPGQLYTPRLPQEAICSVLVDQAWSLAGKRVINGVARQCVTPGKMAIQLNNRAGVIRGGPGFLREDS